MKLRNLLFGRSGGYYLFWSGAIYFAVGMYCIFVNNFVPVWLAQIAWITVLCLPFAIPPFGRWLNMDITWDKTMFNLFGKKNKDADNVVKFPQLTQPIPPMPEATPPTPPKEKEPEGKIYYRLGLTDNDRVAFSMAYGEITMNRAGIQQMIDQLKFFQSQLSDDDGGGNDPDGGEPVPVPEQVVNLKSKKAA